MQLKDERIGRNTNKAFATPWEVCFDVAHPPLADVLRYLCFSFCLKEGQRMRRASALSFFL